MFGGIVAGRGRVVEVAEAPGAARRLVIDIAALGRKPRRGDSISVAGTCLTVVSTRGRRAAFDVIGETVRCTTLGGLLTGDEVNLEGALRVGDEIGGHQVSGHVDGMGTVRTVERRRDETWLTIVAPREVHETLVPKGFVAVDGASLTIASLGDRTFSVGLIPATLEITTLSRLVPGSRVNLEGDALGKHVRRWLTGDARRVTRSRGGLRNPRTGTRRT
jgi:riboflavin synthase